MNPSLSPCGPATEHSETPLALEVATRDPSPTLAPTFPRSYPPGFLVASPPSPGSPLPGICPGLPPTAPTRHATPEPMGFGFLPQKLLELGQTPGPQELTTSASAQTVHRQMDFWGPPECREPGPGRVEPRFIFLLTAVSQLSIFPRTNLRPRFPWLSLPVSKQLYL